MKEYIAIGLLILIIGGVIGVYVVMNEQTQNKQEYIAAIVYNATNQSDITKIPRECIWLKQRDSFGYACCMTCLNKTFAYHYKDTKPYNYECMCWEKK